MTTPNVIDISQWQGTGSSIDFANLKSNGIKAVIIRLGHGTTTDPSAKSFITAVQKAGLRIHGYHYYEGVSGELEFTIKNASSLGLPLESYYFLDMEGEISGNWADIFRTYYTSWLQVGRRVGLYVSDSPYKQYFDDNELTGHGVYRWIASYSYEPTNYDTWQFNSQGGWGNYTSNLDKDYDKTGYLINGSATIKPKDDSDPNKEYQVVAGAFVGFDYSTTKLQGGKMLVHSPNGVDKIPSISPRGLEFDQPAADRLWPYLKKYVTSGSDGQTPQITSNGHWQIGNNVTDYSVGMLDTDDSTTLLDLRTDKAIYYPSEKVVFHATSVSGHGHLDVHYYHLNNLVAEKQVYYGTSEISWSWFLPADDNVGYSVVIDNYVGNNVGYNNKIAINVSSNVYQFPIMGFLSSYGTDSSTGRKQVLDYMKRLHINLVQMYDWFDLHSLPLPVATNGDSTQVSNTWTDIGNRLTRKKVIEDYCNAIKDYGMKPLAYMAMNGSDTNQLVHGLSAEMFLYNDNSKSLDSVYKTLDKNNGWGKYSLWNTNWMNGPWQDYIVNQMQIVRDNMPFDGWHIDMFGDPGDKYEANGNPITSATLAGGIHYFLNKANNLNWDIGVNSVGEYGLTDIRNSTVPKYLYTEVWDNRKTYDDLFNLVKFLTESRDSNNVKKGVIIAAYMDYNYAKANQGKNFNDDGIILTDLVIMASGGMHLEVGEHLLDNEYFPNNNLNMSDNLKNTYLPEMYDFFTAFKEIIGLGYQVDGLATIDGGSVDSLVAGKVCGISRGNDKGYLGLSVINMQTNGDQWRDTDANRTITKPVGNVRVNLKLGVTNHDWYLFNLENLTPQKLNVGADGVINISGLGYYSFILGVPIT